MLITAQLAREKAEALAKADALFAMAKQEDRALTDAERASIQAHLDQAAELQKKIEAGRGDEELRERMAAYRTQEAGRTTERKAEMGRGVAARTIGQIVAEGLQPFLKAGGHRAQTWTSPTIEIGAETLTTSTDPASGGALITPDFRPGIWPILFEPPTVRSLIAPGTTDSNIITYFVETLATNAARGVEEGDDKPESTLRFGRVSDEVKKIATWIPVTTEMLQDFAQIRSYINTRLQGFIDMEEDSQLLNGDGNDGELLGIRNRPGLSPLVTRGAGENLMDAVHRQITRLMVNAFVLPDGIVMHPFDWEVAALSKASGTGNYLGVGPFASMMRPTMWGLPVVPTTKMTQGRSLVGAFRMHAQYFTKEGLAISASNSHADFFVKNKVAILAEKRGALAVYRPAAFGEVAVGESESES